MELDQPITKQVSVLYSSDSRIGYVAYPEQAQMSKGEYGWSDGHVVGNLNAEVLVGSSHSGVSRCPWSSIQHASKPVSGFRADPIVAASHGKGNADFGSGRR